MMKKISKVLFNRIVLVSLALLLQIGWWLFVFWYLSSMSRIANAVIVILSILVVLWMVSKRINPSYKLAWTIVIMAIPVFGLALYLLFGESRIASDLQKRYEAVLKEGEELLQEKEEVREAIDEINPTASNQSRYIRDYAEFPLHDHTTARYFKVGDEFYPVLLQELRNAQHYIFMEYFIINDGIMWKTILQILEEKAASGVDVRLIYDDMGCITTLPGRFYRQLQQKGIKCAAFNPFRPLLSVILNNRDHRKICVVDGHTGFTGGINLADEYINQKERFGHWKDSAVMLKGDAVWNLTAMFLQMWTVITSLPVDFQEYLPHKYHPGEFTGDGFVQPYCDTPLDNEIVGENVYLNMINRAKNYIYMCTPYLIIDNEVMTALCLAAKSGVDVRIMTPGIPDKKMVFLLTQSYYEQLIEAGVKIYQYTPGFLHGKSFVCDDEIATVGTINMDYRSLYLHFENGVWICNNPAVMAIKKDFEETIKVCERISLEFCKERNMFIRGMQSVLRLFAPML